MKKIIQYIILITIGVIGISSCKKNFSQETFIQTVNPTIPDFATQINAGVNGFITDENNNAVQGATVHAGAITITTDQFGYFNIPNTAFAKSAGFIQIIKAGYFTGYKTFLPVEGKETFIRLQLIPKTTTGNFDAATGGVVTTADGATISLPANAVVVAANNTNYIGTVNVFAHWFNPSQQDKTQLTMPGNLLGIDSAGHLNALVTYGMVAVELQSPSGQLLQIAPNKKATIQFPIPASEQANAPNTILLWYFNETNGVWQQEGWAIKNANNYFAAVSHFSYWNCDYPSPLVNLKAQMLNTQLQPLANMPVEISRVNNPADIRIAYTNAEGVINGLVPASASLLLKAIMPCSQERVLAKAITTVNNDVDAGSFIVELPQYGVVINGTVKKCNGNPVTKGRVIIIGSGGNNVALIANGNFSKAGLACPAANAAIIAIDEDANQQSATKNLVLQAGINDAGAFNACNILATELITIASTTDSTFALPQFLFNGNFYFLNDSTSINAIDLLNGNTESFQFAFTGPATAGNYALSNNKFKYGDLYWQFNTPTVVNISSYGLVGQFITGSFAGTATALISPPSQTKNFIINFNIKRDQ